MNVNQILAALHLLAHRSWKISALIMVEEQEGRVVKKVFMLACLF